MARLSRLKRGGRGLGVAKLTDQNGVRVLPQRAPQRFAERSRVDSDLTLVDDAAFVRDG